MKLTGLWRPSPNPTVQSRELHVEEVDVVGPADATVCKGYKFVFPDAITEISGLDLPTSKEISNT